MKSSAVFHLGKLILSATERSGFSAEHSGKQWKFGAAKLW